ncbi:MAG: spore coat U domain-containing protein [Novosphingobium sp.]|nr:spore coat U domain-containing protein [Novosphingobium sp.]
MNRWRIGAILATAGGYALTATPGVAAGRATYQIPVSVNPVASCTVSAAPLIFMIPVPINGSVDSSTTITVKCPPNTPYTVDIDRGLYPQGINRRAYNVDANAYVTYDVYKDPPRSQVWGTGGTKVVAGNSGTSGTVEMTVYGRVSSSKSLKAGGYRDTLTITLAF